MDEKQIQQIQQMIVRNLKNSFSKRIGDTPTDKYQLTPKKYVDNQISSVASSTTTFTNKRITKRVGSVTSGASYTIDTDSYDCFSFTALGTNINSISASGTPTNFQTLIVRIKDNGTARTIVWDVAKFSNYGVALPSTTVISKVLTVGFIYNSAQTIWGCVASAEQ